MKRLIQSASLAIPLALAGCFSTSNLSDSRPIDVPEAFGHSEQGALEVRESLLQLFSDPALSEIVETALANNPDLLRAQARLEEVGYTLTRTRASLFPKLSVGAGAGRSQAVAASPSSVFSAELDASWEVDIWGKLRSLTKASKSDFAAAQADFDNAKQSLAAQTMQAWFALVAADKLLDLDQRRVESFATTEKLVQRRFDLGEANSSALNLARTDLQNAKADLEATKDRRDQAARRVQAITGSYPSSQYASALEWPNLTATVAEGLPSELLESRPDVLAAYNRVAAADSRVRSSKMALFPSFRLTASGGRRSSVLEDLSDSAFDSWSALAALSTTLFDAGARRSDIGAAKSRAAQAYYSYQSVVLNALREVENALGSESYLASEETARTAALEAARQSLSRSQRDYETGLTSILSLLETQRRVFNTERQVINLKASRLNNRVSLALALGKGA